MIQEGDQLIIRKDKNMKSVQLRKNRKIWMEKVTFTMEDVVGMPYGSTFEVKNGRMVKVKKERDIGEQISKEGVDTSNNQGPGADNRNLQDQSENQKLQRDDIVALKSEGVGGEAIIDQLIEHSATFKEKTEYSKEKYIKKKKKKHLPFYTILKPTTRLVAEMFYNRGPAKICNMRIDTLAQLLTQANVRAGSKVLLFENCSGLVLAAIMERLGGHGEIVQIFNGDQPNRIALESYNFSKDYQKMLRSFPLDQVNSLEKIASKDTDSESEGNELDNVETCDSDEGESPQKQAKLDDSNSRVESDDKTNKNETNSKVTETKNSNVVETKEDSSDTKPDSQVEQCLEQLKRKLSGEAVEEAMDEGNSVPGRTQGAAPTGEDKEGSSQGTKRKKTKREKRKEWRERHHERSRKIIQKGDMDCLIVACKFHPTPLVLKLLEFVAPSRPIVIYCQYKEPLLDCYYKLKNMREGIVQVNLTETWLREYQVLPERTHPIVNMSGTGGYLLTGTTVET